MDSSGRSQLPVSSDGPGSEDPQDLGFPHSPHFPKTSSTATQDFNRRFQPSELDGFSPRNSHQMHSHSYGAVDYSRHHERLPEEEEEQYAVEEAREPSYMEKLNLLLNDFWAKRVNEISSMDPYSDAMFKYEMPLARIKKIMRFDPTVVMIGSDAPILLSKACELIIGEIVLRAWHHTDFSRRRTIKFSDIVAALPKTDVFDFLIDIVPRDDVDPPHLQQDQVQPPQHHGSMSEFSDNILANPPNLFQKQGQEQLMEMVPKIMELLKAVQKESGNSHRDDLRLPDIGSNDSSRLSGRDNLDMAGLNRLASLTPSEMVSTMQRAFDPTKMQKLIELSRKKLTDFPEEWLPAMMLILQSSFLLDSQADEERRQQEKNSDSVFDALVDQN